MILFLKKIVIFSTIILLGLLCVELLLFTKENEYSYKCHYIENHLNDIKVLTLGASLFEVSIDPSTIGDSVFNGNLSGIRNIYNNSATYQMIFNYIPRMKNLKTLIVPFPITDAYAGSDNWKYESSPADRSCTCMRVKYLNILLDVRDIIYWSEIINSKMDFLGRFNKPDEECRGCDSLGFVSKNRELKNRKVGWDKIKNNLNSDIKTRNDTYSVIQAYDKIANLCEQNNVKLIAVATPYYKTKQKQISSKTIDDYNYVIEEIKKRHPRVLFYNYTYDKRFTSDDFQDPVHLNNNGAQKFSKILKEEVLEIKYKTTDE